MAASFVWHDYETFGTDPARDRPSQFAARRTDENLEPIGKPLVIYCQPAIDVLPAPEACLITGITPQQARDEGLPEYEFARQIDEVFSVPETCAAGYNSIRFDDEFTRHLLYRNFHEVYLREWRGGNSRWDLIDVVRLWHALRPEGLEWPVGDNGATTFKLERLSKANGLTHEKAHDALSDVDATIALARRLKTAQPRLFEHALKLRDKKFAATLLNVTTMAPVVHVSSKIPAARGCMAVIAAIAMHPTNANCVLTFDLSSDIDELLELDADDIRDRVFAAADDLPDGIERLPLKGVHLNKSPMLSPIATLRGPDAERWGIDLAACLANHAKLVAAGDALKTKVREVFTQEPREGTDPELSLYGGFLPDADRARLAKVRNAGPDSIARLHGTFADARYDELLFRYRARHYPETLDEDERARWQDFVAGKLRYDTGLSTLTLDAYRESVAALAARERHPDKLRVLAQLAVWPEESGLERLLRG
ncbi:exodeoxyribonuclease I [Nevskia sp.]|uniref:exodeoxyribonuclease I n=1 Tax=Nevskia sp. TaxID=1929292 RepID=UPI0025DE3DF2|nr:exodeoxyribonuclease I [Nevskia sp.]